MNLDRDDCKGTSTAIKQAFRRLDVNKDGCVSQSELEGVFRNLGDWSDEEFATLFSAVDANADGKLNCDEFLDWLLNSSVRTPEEIEKEICEVVKAAEQAGMEWMTHFSEYDGDCNGEMDLSEFRNALEKLGVRCSEREAMFLFNDRDWTHNGVLSKQEFRDFIHGKAVRLMDEELAADDGVFQSKPIPDDTGRPDVVARSGTALVMEDL